MAAGDCIATRPTRNIMPAQSSYSDGCPPALTANLSPRANDAISATNKWVVAGDVLFPEDGYQLGLCPIRKPPGSAR
jgi:hypothetical protein